MVLGARLLAGSLLAIALSAMALACAVPTDPVPASEFPTEQRFSRAVAGRVYSDAALVDDALVRAEVSPLSGADRGQPFGLLTATTNPSGYFQFENAPFVYDLSLRIGSRFIAFRNVSYRYFDPQVGRSLPAKGFEARASVLLEPPLDEGTEVAFFASGPDVATLATDAAGVLVLGLRSFEATVTLHAVTFPKHEGLAAATGYGRVDLDVTAGQVTGTSLRVDAIAQRGTTTISAVVPKGLALDGIDVGLDFGVRTISRNVTKVGSDEAFTLPLVPFARWFAEARASSELGRSDSGRFFFDPASPLGTRVTLVDLPTPGEVVGPTLETGTSGTEGAPLSGLLARGAGEGILEHVLTSQAGGPTLVVFTREPEAVLPDPSRFGQTAVAGTYAWTMRHFPLAPEFKYVQGADGFTYQPSAQSAPRTVTLR